MDLLVLTGDLYGMRQILINGVSSVLITVIMAITVIGKTGWWLSLPLEKYDCVTWDDSKHMDFCVQKNNFKAPTGIGFQAPSLMPGLWHCFDVSKTMS